MSDVGDLTALLVGHIETVLGASTLIVQPDALVDLQDGQGVFANVSASPEAAPYQQQIMSYGWQLEFKRASAGDVIAVREAMQSDFDTIEAAIKADQLFAADGIATLVSSIKDGAAVFGSMAVGIRVTR